MARSTWAASTDAYRQHLQTLGRSPHTVETTFSALGNFARFCRTQRRCPCPELTPPWLASLYGLYARWTVRGYFFALRSFLRWQNGANPLAEIPVPRERDVPIRPYSHSELRRFLRAARNDPRNTALLLLLISSGMRASELVALSSGDVDWETGTLLIRNGKGGKNRRVAPGTAALGSLNMYLTSQHIRRGWLFPGLNSGHLRSDSLYHLVERLGDRTGVAGANVHRFRHTFSHEFLTAGGDVGDLKEILGHSTIAMSLRYARYFAADRALEAQRRYNPADRLTGVV
jgi:integrase/recombinase XerD